MTHHSFLHLFIESRRQIAIEIERILKSGQQADNIFPFDQILFEDLLSYCTSGKYFRGSLFLMTTEMVVRSHEVRIDDSDLVKIAASLELYGSGLLIHDDIMDKDELRRGGPTLHIKWQEYGREQHISSPAHWAESAAICAGDYLYFLAGSILGDLELSTETSKRLTIESQQQLRLLGLAQIEDLRLAGLQKFPSAQEIRKMFEGKTGHYTGAWPLVFAGIVADVPDHEIEVFRKVGVELGVLYQMVDDKLGIFGSLNLTGKSNNSDIREGKKTLYSGELYKHLAETANSDDLRSFETIFGNHHATEAECDSFRHLIKKYHVDTTINATIASSVKMCHRLVDDLRLMDDVKQLLHWVTDFIAERDW